MAKAKNKVVAVGVAPWGIVERKEDLIGHDVSDEVYSNGCAVCSVLKVNVLVKGMLV